MFSKITDMPAEFRREMLMRMMKLLDLAALCVVFLAAMAISSGSYSWPKIRSQLIIRIALANLLLFMGYLVVCRATFSICGFYQSYRLSQWRGRLSQVFIAATVITGVLVMMKRVWHFWFATDVFLVLFWFLSLATLFLFRESVRALLLLARLHGRNLRHVVIIGDGADATVLAKRIREEAGLGYHVVKVIDIAEADNVQMDRPVTARSSGRSAASR
jgi:FlaA1/EpsC-like NDP-sugar epimerase